MRFRRLVSALAIGALVGTIAPAAARAGTLVSGDLENGRGATYTRDDLPLAGTSSWSVNTTRSGWCSATPAAPVTVSVGAYAPDSNWLMPQWQPSSAVRFDQDATLVFTGCGVPAPLGYGLPAGMPLGRTMIQAAAGGGTLPSGDPATPADYTSTSLHINVRPRRPGEPQAVANPDRSIQISWAASPDDQDITGYQIRRKLAYESHSDWSAALAELPHGVLSYRDATAPPGSYVCYQLRAILRQAVPSQAFPLVFDSGQTVDACIHVPEATAVPPTISVTTPAEGAEYQRSSAVAAAYSCSAPGSEIASCVGSVEDGAALDTSTLGPHVFTVDATSAAGLTAHRDVHYSVVPGPPTAADDSASVPEDGSVSIDVLANDHADADGLRLSLDSLPAQPAHGTAQIEDGKVRYAPAAGYFGPDGFSYRVCDDGQPAQCAVGTVDIDVTEVNAPPHAVDDHATVAQDGSVTIDPLANDDAGAADESGQALTLSAVDAPSYGTAERAGDTVVYHTRPGHEGADWFTYRVCDDGTTNGQPDPQCATATVTVWVQPAPKITPNAETDPIGHPSPAGGGIALWRDPQQPADSAVLLADGGTSTDAGAVYVDGLDGKQIDSAAGGHPSSLDVTPMNFGTSSAPDFAPLVAAGDLQSDTILTYRLDASRHLVPTGSVTSPQAIAGSCLFRDPDNGNDYVFATNPDGPVAEWLIRWSTTLHTVVSSPAVRMLNGGDGTGGCAVDSANQQLYVVEQDRGIRAYDADFATGAAEGRLIDTVGGDGHLPNDVDAVSVVAGAGPADGYIVASADGGRALVFYSRGPSPQWLRTVRVDAGEGAGPPRALGLAGSAEGLGTAFPAGMLAVGDQDNEGPDQSVENPNAKLFDLAAVTADATPEPPQFPARPTDCQRPYTPDSPWNSPIPASAALDPASGALVANLAGKGPLTSDPDQFTFPVYRVGADTPSVTVALSGVWSDVGGDGSTLALEHPGTVTVPIPDGAQPAEGSDGQLVVVDPATGDEWGFWQLERSGGGWSATNGYHYNVRWSGVPPLTADGNPFGSRGAGVPYLAGLVTPCEIDRGEIDHALAFAYDSPSSAFVYPASKSDGGVFGGVLGTDLPEGTRIRLDPALTTADITAFGCTGPCLTIARALQQYGAYVVDHAGRSKVMLEYRATAHWHGDVGEDTVSPIPVSRFTVLAPATPPGG